MFGPDLSWIRDKITDKAFENRKFILFLFSLVTLFFAFQAAFLRIDAGFEKQLPKKHPYIQTFLQYRSDFGGANRVLISIAPKKGDIFTPEFMQVFSEISEEAFFIRGVNRSTIESIFTPNVRFVEIIEGGFAGGSVVPADYDNSPEMIERVRHNVLKSNIIGRLVSKDFSAALISLELSDIDPKTGEKLDYINIGNQIEKNIRNKYADRGVSIHIIGFAKAISDIANGAKGALIFLIAAVLIIGLLVRFFIGSWRFMGLVIFCSLIGVVWSLGLLTTLGYGLDPMSLLIPFLIFAIGVSHGIQMVNGVNYSLFQGMTIAEGAKASFKRLVLPGVVALLSDTLGFLTIYFINIKMIQDLAVAASLGVLTLVLTNLIMLPLLLSFLEGEGAQKARLEKMYTAKQWVWDLLSLFATKRGACLSISTAIVLYAFSFYLSQGVKIGDLHAGVPELQPDSNYNQDARHVASKYTIGVDIFSIIVETEPNSCIDYNVMKDIDEFQWELSNNPYVQSTLSLPQMMKVVSAAWNEGHYKWQELSRNSQVLVQAVATVVKNSSLLMNNDCSALPIFAFLTDHKAETIDSVVNTVNQLKEKHNLPNVNYRLASGNVGVMAAVNDTVADAQYKIILWVYISIIALCMALFRSFRATACVVLPLTLVSVLAYAIMVLAQIGLKTSTLPVAALGVGIGVDYGIYIFSQLRLFLRDGVPLKEAYHKTLEMTGNAVLITGLALSLSVLTWIFSDLKFQGDMGLIFSFMLIANMLAAISLVPAIAYFLYPKNR